MQGQICDRTLADLIYEITFDDLSGVLRIEQARVKAAIYAEAGRVVFASSNLRQHRLGTSLKRWNTLRDQDWARLASVLAPSSPPSSSLSSGASSSAQMTSPSSTHAADLPDAELLAALRCVNLFGDEEIMRWQSRQAEEVLRFVLNWQDGAWTFDSRARLASNALAVPSATGQAHINLHKLLIEAARGENVEAVERRFGNDDEIISLADAPPVEIILEPLEAFVLSRVAGSMTLAELLQVSAVSPAETQACVYRLALGGLLRRANPPRTLTAEAIALHQKIRHQQEEAARIAATTAKEPDANSEPNAATDAERAATLFAHASAGNHYAMLGVSYTAAPEQIKTAYYALAKRFHPDVFARTLPDAMRERIAKAFARIATAYETLRNEASRHTYDLKLQATGEYLAAEVVTPSPLPNDTASAQSEARKETATVGDVFTTTAVESNSATEAKTNDSPDMSAEECFQAAQDATKDGDTVLALRRLTEAARLAPDNPRYRADYGRALAADRRTYHQAEAELRAAVALAPADSAYRIMLAEFYRDINLPRRAEGELTRLLAAKPRDERARRLLDELRRVIAKSPLR